MTTRNLLRQRDGNHARVSFAELFFDLVFVFAVTQLSHGLLAHPTPMGFVETGMLFLAVWWCWIDTAWCTNWLDPERTPVRLMLFGLMACGLAMSIAIPQAFGDRAALFAVGYSVMQVGRSLFMMAALRRQDPANYVNFIRITVWAAAGAVFWLAGAFVPEMRIALWGIALLLDSSAPAFGYRLPGMGKSDSRDWVVEGGHVAERCGLFVIIALGESILITGATFSDLVWNTPVLLGFVSAFASTIAMWWIYFNIGAERGSHRIEHSDDPGSIARLAYTYLHLPIGAGIVLVAASDEMVLTHPDGHLTVLAAFCLVGGPALYLLGNLLFKRAIGNRVPLSHLIGLGLSAALGASFVLHPTPLHLSMGSTAILVLVAMWETLSYRRGRKS
ncbi:low temperature requirement protein A [Sphingomonas sp. G-3-2-10]|uniref:low temperature requirement protein A n=1 Tax=Sphingomonas sp. G-3-2-10 TaxID=2728838 RepID=UPI00146B7028|nr:low temperature requirement protein A [Sphingomonas sp. G-3-2-10]NML07172.1 low temperature requirement protein A [Sphingomonas sp. G-3-2-10]